MQKKGGIIMGFWIFMFMTTLLIPVMMIVFGLIFLKNPPKEINWAYGYRTSMSMKNQETWDLDICFSSA